MKFQCCLFTISEFDQGGGAASAAPPPMGGLGLSQRPVFQAGYGPQSLGEAYQPVGGGRGDGRDGGQMSFRQQYLEQVSTDAQCGRMKNLLSSKNISSINSSKSVALT